MVSLKARPLPEIDSDESAPTENREEISIGDRKGVTQQERLIAKLPLREVKASPEIGFRRRFLLVRCSGNEKRTKLPV